MPKDSETAFLQRSQENERQPIKIVKLRTLIYINQFMDNGTILLSWESFPQCTITIPKSTRRLTDSNNHQKKRHRNILFNEKSLVMQNGKR